MVKCRSPRSLPQANGEISYERTQNTSRSSRSSEVAISGLHVIMRITCPIAALTLLCRSSSSCFDSFSFSSQLLFWADNISSMRACMYTSHDFGFLSGVFPCMSSRV